MWTKILYIIDVTDPLESDNDLKLIINETGHGFHTKISKKCEHALTEISFFMPF